MDEVERIADGRAKSRVVERALAALVSNSHPGGTSSGLQANCIPSDAADADGACAGAASDFHSAPRRRSISQKES